MLDVKKKVIGGLQSMLDDRLAGRLKPKAAAVSVEVEKPAMGMGHEAMGHDEGEPGEGMPPEGGELKGELPEGADLSKLSPAEQAQLAQLYEKMGC